MSSFPDGASGKEPACQCRRHRRHDSIPESGRFPAGGHDSPLQDSCLGNPMDRGGWRAKSQGVAKSQTKLKWLSMHAQPFMSQSSINPNTPETELTDPSIPGVRIASTDALNKVKSQSPLTATIRLSTPAQLGRGNIPCWVKPYELWNQDTQPHSKVFSNALKTAGDRIPT